MRYLDAHLVAAWCCQTFFLALIGLLVAWGNITLLRAILRAPEGTEDRFGFHHRDSARSVRVHPHFTRHRIH